MDLGEVARADLGAAAEATFGLEEPGVAGPVETSLGPALFRVNAILSAQETPFEAVRDELLAETAADRAQREIDDMIDDINDRLAGGATLEDLAAETAMELGRVAMRPGVPEAIAGYEAFRDAAAAVESGDFPEVATLEDGGIFALRLDSVEPPRLQDYEEVRASVRDAWQGEKTAELLRAQAETTADALRAGTPASELGLAAQDVDGVLRDGFVAGLPEEAIPAIFEMEPDEVRVLSDPDGAVVIQLFAITPADGTSAEARQLKAAFAGQSAQSISTDLIDAFTRAVEADAGISLDQSTISAVAAQLR